MKKILTPDMDRVLNEYRVMETSFRNLAQPNQIINGCREITPKITREQEKPNCDLCNLKPGEVAYKDIAKVEALARRSTRHFTREMVERNIIQPELEQ